MALIIVRTTMTASCVLLCLDYVLAYHNSMAVEKPTINDIYTISRLNREVRAVLEDVFPTIWVQGEISNLARPASGHIYFSLKDSNAQVRCAMFKNRQFGMRFKPENGMEVLARANVGLYEGRGEFQLIIESMEPAGEGALQLAFEALKKKLSAEGLFDEVNKQTVPTFPKTIGVITSPSGAAIRDIISVLSRRYPSGKLIIYPVPVQGEGAGNKIAAAVKTVNQRNECEVLILARGGGSLEDLWAFNEEVVARAVFDSAIPTVSGVGHEIDFSIADFVADQRAATPSAAAELVSPDADKLLELISRYKEQLVRIQTNQITQLQRHTDHLAKQLPHPQQRLQSLKQKTDEYTFKFISLIERQLTQNKHSLSELLFRLNQHNPIQRITQHKQRLNNVESQLTHIMKYQLNSVAQRLMSLQQQINIISPIATLERGYAIVIEKQNGNIVRQSSGLNQGDILNIRLAKGNIDTSVTNIHEK